MAGGKPITLGTHLRYRVKFIVVLLPFKVPLLSPKSNNFLLVVLELNRTEFVF